MEIQNSKTTEKVILGPAVAVDAVLFTVTQEQLKVLLIKLSTGPYSGHWALPGGLVQLEESLDEAAKRALFQKANIGDIHLEQLYTFGSLDRDIRGRVISVAYFSLVPNVRVYEVKTPPRYSEIAWCAVAKLPPMAFDHQQIISYAYQRLQSKLEYSNIVYSLLPKEFTLTQLQQVYEIILDRRVDKRNFRKKILSLGLIDETGHEVKGEPHRPAKLYQFLERKITYF